MQFLILGISHEIKLKFTTFLNLVECKYFCRCLQRCYQQKTLERISPIDPLLLLHSIKRDGGLYKISKHELYLNIPFRTGTLVVALQVAETALGASIQDPTFHKVRDVAPNKVLTHVDAS